MATPTNHWKLGLFVVTSLCVALGVVAYLAAQSLKTDTLEYKSYYDESVQGLEVGSPVKFRGVTIGNVSHIDVAQDRRHVEVTYSMTVKTLKQMGLSNKEERDAKMRVPPDMRAQLAAAGITGVKFIQIDYFNEKDWPAPTLPFPTPANYIPSAPSMMKNLEDAVVKTVNQFPDLAQETLKLMNRINHFVGELDDQKLPTRVVETLDKASSTFADVQTTVKRLDTAQLSSDAHQTLKELNATIARFDQILGRLESDRGLLTSANRAAEALGDTARGTRGVGRQLETTLREVSETAQAIRKLADALEQDPDMLLKGRSKKTP